MEDGKAGRFSIFFRFIDKAGAISTLKGMYTCAKERGMLQKMEKCKMKQFQKIVEKIARENGTTPENVMRQMQRAIDQAYDSRNAGSATMWAGMTFRGEKPTPEELVLQLAMRMQGSSAR
ncbi:sporulation initiation factor Spo0A C-terminal domain-containing protein [uncultured Allofournierella sp.]|uniref:sporulation initiation factor Spo0A C-terminal domain-containing protein n=1 Tax=uncultured Allofournierella sp. TaxID=1940258 RepID=UPI0025EC379E|nr:sporulation initiation factor Spo0A C-terminal domain-containing protein [uncultured Fournierella sp.]